MENITDKYHQPILPDNKHLSPLFDIKEVPKRTYQIGLAIIFTGICMSCYNAAIGMYVSSFLVACFCFSVLMFILLKYHDAIKDLTISIISMVCTMLVFAACFEGLQSEQYLYFFPLLIAVPLLIDLKTTRYKKISIFVSIILFSFVICICIGRYVTPLESFTVSQINRLALANRIVAIFSTIAFAALYAYFEKRYIEELVEQSNKVINTKTQFLATMGHELRTPLNGIIGVVSFLKDESDAAKQEEYIQTLQYVSNHMLQLVNDILDFNKIEAGKFKLHLAKLNLLQLLVNTSKPFFTLCEEKNLEIKVEIDPSVDVPVFADGMRLVQVINNLLANALKFTNTGFIKLKAVCKKKDQRTMVVSFIVEDTGIGIDRADHTKIFESFWQVYDENTKQLTGTGLGLSISIRILKLMGSTLTLESEKGKGSKFSFDLIFDYAHKPSPVHKTKVIDSGDLLDTNILLVEDNKLNMMVAKKILTGLKATVTVAYDGREALDALEDNADFNIILMDLEMPVMNGYTAIYEMKKLFPHIPVIALTASLVDEKMLADLLASGFNDCVLKPFQPHELLAMIQKHLKRQPAIID
jgi:signal transduction histidine kinase/CheY-like chemotaxis protein